ncbi:hypothetical protein J2S74_002293 [Evansella vedderi]|uniref:Uncharacterized protein n=1 Tax=Evansella vedderi TaxID=38282 RepID=A0ABT9ZUI6_9BACI|nr:hypothetical protein [Evansella vedderi]MDQ0254911.1 hypothetical protein [Evansella vedderi]
MVYRVWQKDGSIDEIENVKTVEYGAQSGFYHFLDEHSYLLFAIPKEDVKAIGRKLTNE